MDRTFFLEMMMGLVPRSAHFFHALSFRIRPDLQTGEKSCEEVTVVFGRDFSVALLLRNDSAKPKSDSKTSTAFQLILVVRSTVLVDNFNCHDVLETSDQRLNSDNGD